MAAPSDKSVALEIRKLRKKLRQIENLERVDRTLLDEEIAKVLNKNILRDHLQRLLSTEQGSQWTSRYQASSAGSETDTSTSFTSDTSIPTDLSRSDIIFEEEEEEEEQINCEGNTNFSASSGVEQQDVQVERGLEKLQKTETPEHKSHDALQTKTKLQGIDTKTNEPCSEKTNQTQKETVPHDQLKTTRQKWHQSFCVISELIGHNDIVTSVFVDGNILISASRDTTVKVWNLEEGRELRSLGGHTGSVTCVTLMTVAASSAYAEAKNMSAPGRLVISGSVDCSYKIWNIKSGEIIQSVYTFNPITKLAFNGDQMVITGTDGGKLELWDLLEGSNQQSLRVHNETITGLKIRGDQVFSSSADGVVKVHVARDWKLSCVFVSENVKSVSGSSLTPRNIHSFDVSDQKIFFGDDAINIKVLDWKKGVARKLPNHTEEFASTDALYCNNNLLISSSYDIDVGRSYINVRSLPRGDYLTSLDDENTNRILCVSCGKLNSGKMVVVSGGAQLKLWEVVANRPDVADDDTVSVIQPKYISRLARPGQDSDVESDTVSIFTEEKFDDGNDDEHNDDGDNDAIDQDQDQDTSQSQKETFGDGNEDDDDDDDDDDEVLDRE
ncbi:F-box/WD repeat-containing protein 7-like [Gigantopelta aegis]|uniref:F-box/WD repeat-containing protein 7-like n=1 Tax=Gigantopelta aegis TaxID=1735272 RepID=UPI001B88E474|nr:F-box/WD repeat-containing protein 7-like [Gigantopelta aegis]